MSILGFAGGAAKRGVELREKAFDEESDTRKLTLKSNLEEAKRIRNENRTKKETYKNLYGGLYGILENDDLVFDIMKRGTANAQAFLKNIQNFEQKTGIDLAVIEQQKTLGMIPDDYVPQQNLPNVDDYIQNVLIGKAGQITPPKDVSGMQAAIKRHFGTTSPEVMSFQTLGQVAALTGQSMEDVSANLEGTRLKERFTSGATISLPIDEAARLTYENTVAAGAMQKEVNEMQVPKIGTDGMQIGEETESITEATARSKFQGTQAQLLTAMAKRTEAKAKASGASDANLKIFREDFRNFDKDVTKKIDSLLGGEEVTGRDGKISIIFEEHQAMYTSLSQTATNILSNHYMNQAVASLIQRTPANAAFMSLRTNLLNPKMLNAALHVAKNEILAESGNDRSHKLAYDKLNLRPVDPDMLNNLLGRRGSSPVQERDDNTFNVERIFTPQSKPLDRATFGDNLQKEIQTRIDNGLIVVEKGIKAADVMQDRSFLSKFNIGGKSIRAAINNEETNQDNLQKAINEILSGTKDKPFAFEGTKKTVEADSSAEEARMKALPITSATQNALQRAERQMQRAEQASTETGIDTRTERIQRQKEEPAMLEAQNFVSEDAELVKALNSRSMLVDFAKRAASLEEGLKNFLQRPPPRGSGIMSREQKSTAYNTEIDNEIEQFAKKYNLSDEIRNKLSTKLKEEIATSNFKDAIEFKSGFGDLSDQEASQVAMLGIKLQNEDGTFKNVEHLRRELSEMTGSSSTSVLAADRN